MRALLVCLSCVAWTASPAGGGFSFQFNSSNHQWDLSNGVIHSVFRIGPDAKFVLVEIDHIPSGQIWKAADGEASSPISVRLGSATYNADTPVRLLDQHVENPDAKTARQVIVLADLGGSVQITLQLEMYSGQPVLRHRVAITNLGFKSLFARAADVVPYSFAADAQTYNLFRVAQWAVAPRSENFQTDQVTLTPDGAASTLLTGSGGSYCGWMAVRDENSRGLFAGWEFDGQTLASMRHRSTEGILTLAAAMQSLYHPVAPGDTFQLPAGFIGLFQGGWDEAGFRTQKFAESVLAQPAPANFPYVSWDSWGYQTGINEQILRQNADAAAAMGVELFIVDLGWAREIGDWREDPAKFPSGLHTLSDHVHSLGMKFGLHFALAEVMPDAPVLLANPDWTSSESYNYDGTALSLCLSNKPTRDWIIQQAVQMIDAYGVDYILQDGQNMVKKCTKSTHTHDPRDSNYSNSVEGINAVVEEIQRQRPQVIWENCENGGNMMTFNMVSHYVTSITNDASGALGSRQGVWGATYPFPPRYADRYMPEDPANSYITGSYMFGGPWHFMNQLAAMDPSMSAFAQNQVQTYKRIRKHIANGQVFHVSVAPAQGHTDAIESYMTASDTAIAIVTRDNSASKWEDVKLQGLSSGQTYQIHFHDDRRVLTMTGEQLLTIGVPVHLPSAESSEIVYVDPLRN
jgi:alpha-galactosidase